VSFPEINLPQQDIIRNLMLFILHTENGRVHSYPVENDIKLRMISCWGRLISGKDTKLSSICYRLLH
jgi:hypothetical protein